MEMTIGANIKRLRTAKNITYYRGGTDEQIIAVMDRELYAKKLLGEARGKNAPLNRAFDSYSEGTRQNILRYTIACRTGATDSRRAELLKNPEYRAVLDKYR